LLKLSSLHHVSNVQTTILCHLPQRCQAQLAESLGEWPHLCATHRAGVVCLEPPAYALQVEGVVAWVQSNTFFHALPADRAVGSIIRLGVLPLQVLHHLFRGSSLLWPFLLAHFKQLVQDVRNVHIADIVHDVVPQ